MIKESSILVSATASPHYTVTSDRLRESGSLPRYAVDLAVPRDIEPSVAELPGVRLWNVDSLGGEQIGSQGNEQLQTVLEIIEEYIHRFYKWFGYRERLHSRSEQI